MNYGSESENDGWVHCFCVPVDIKYDVGHFKDALSSQSLG